MAAAIAALQGMTFDRELLYLAAMFHHTGIRAGARRRLHGSQRRVGTQFTDSHHVPADTVSSLRDRHALHPRRWPRSGAEAYLLSARASVDVFGLRSNELPDAVRQSVIQEYPRLGFKREFAGLLRAEASKSLVAAPGTCTASP